MMDETVPCHASKGRTSRRDFTVILLVLAGVVSGSPAVPGRPIDELELPPEILAELQRQAEPVLRQAKILAELPLEGVAPAFHFHPIRRARPL
jgi:hypothetical protein